VLLLLLLLLMMMMMFRECEAYSRMVANKVDFNDEEEKEAVQAVFNNAMECVT
jgi:Tfp pilus assembly protein PilX